MSTILAYVHMRFLLSLSLSLSFNIWCIAWAFRDIPSTDILSIEHVLKNTAKSTAIAILLNICNILCLCLCILCPDWVHLFFEQHSALCILSWKANLFSEFELSELSRAKRFCALYINVIVINFGWFFD